MPMKMGWRWYGDGIAFGPDVQPQGVGAHQRPGVQLGAAPCDSLPDAAARKPQQEGKAEDRHLTAGKCFGKRHKKQTLLLEMLSRGWAC